MLSKRFGFEYANYEAIQNQIENESHKGSYVIKASPGSKSESTWLSVHPKVNKQSITRNIEFLKMKLERETEIHRIEMEQLAKKKEFLIKVQQLEHDLKRKRDKLSNEFRGNDSSNNCGKYEYVNEMAEPNDEHFGFMQCKLKTAEDKLSNNITSNNECTHHKMVAHQFEKHANERAQSIQNEKRIDNLKPIETPFELKKATSNIEHVSIRPIFENEYKKSIVKCTKKSKKNGKLLQKALDWCSEKLPLLSTPIVNITIKFNRLEWIWQYWPNQFRSGKLIISRISNRYIKDEPYFEIVGEIWTLQHLCAKLQTKTSYRLRNGIQTRVTQRTRKPKVKMKKQFERVGVC